MAHVLILGAHGKIAQLATQQLLAETNHHLTLLARHPEQLTITDPKRETVIQGDATDQEALQSAMHGQEIVYANLANPQIEQQAQAVIAAMNATQVRRLIWISTLGIYDEVPGAFGQWNHQMLDGGYLEPYAAAARVVEDSPLDYTIIRPAWLTNNDTVNFEVTQKGELFKGTEVSRKSVAALVVQLINDPTHEVRHSLGVNQPNTNGDKPAFY